MNGDKAVSINRLLCSRSHGHATGAECLPGGCDQPHTTAEKQLGDLVLHEWQWAAQVIVGIGRDGRHGQPIPVHSTNVVVVHAQSIGFHAGMLIKTVLRNCGYSATRLRTCYSNACTPPWRQACKNLMARVEPVLQQMVEHRHHGVSPTPALISTTGVSRSSCKVKLTHGWRHINHPCLRVYLIVQNG